ncbi:unnamed protein product [Dracunculus medinensis]|uniref:Large ribosomal subunit protein uL18 n=1 Tax=Dracunculus medinensis TaxID=318479 RepID=A0A0N4UGD8_DRAME|nr:unnamed protein product [Dracunculus medinensis]
MSLTFASLSETRFFGYNAENKEYNATAHRDRIFGKHVADYMALLKEEDEDAYKRHFSKFIAAGVNAENLEEMYKSAHEKIRADPSPASKREKVICFIIIVIKGKRYNARKSTLAVRRNRVRNKKAYLLKLKTQEEK